MKAPQHISTDNDSKTGLQGVSRILCCMTVNFVICMTVNFVMDVQVMLCGERLGRKLEDSLDLVVSLV